MLLAPDAHFSESISFNMVTLQFHSFLADGKISFFMAKYNSHGCVCMCVHACIRAYVCSFLYPFFCWWTL